jgi:hypothetical protein
MQVLVACYQLAALLAKKILGTGNWEQRTGKKLPLQHEDCKECIGNHWQYAHGQDKPYY